mgnify:FL=1|nr:MAG TPA: HNH endonuclease bacteriophage, HNH Endonuclease, DNA.52A [Caudoviricetes sp.]
MAWATSTRRDRLPKDWPNIRAKIIRRARGMCEATDHDPRCNGKGTEVDHITPGDNHSLNNLRLLNTFCHRKVTAEYNTRRRRERAAMRKRPSEPHPGKIQKN